MKDTTLTVITEDGIQHSVVVRNKERTIEFEVVHWFAGPITIELKKPHARELGRQLVEFMERDDPQEAVVV